MNVKTAVCFDDGVGLEIVDSAAGESVGLLYLQHQRPGYSVCKVIVSGRYVRAYTDYRNGLAVETLIGQSIASLGGSHVVLSCVVPDCWDPNDSRPRLVEGCIEFFQVLCR